MGLDIYLYRTSKHALAVEAESQKSGDKYTHAYREEIAYFRKFWAFLDRFPEYQYGEKMEISKDKLIELRDEAFKCVKAICEAYKGELECSPLGLDTLHEDVPSSQKPYGEYSEWIHFIPEYSETTKEDHERILSFEEKLKKIIEENYLCKTRHPDHYKSMVILNNKTIDYDFPYYNDISYLYCVLDSVIRETDFDNGEIILLNADW